MANPTLLRTPIASGGDKNTIPETTGSTTGLLSQEKGWQQINSLPINAGGIAPSRLDFNGVFNLLSNILFYAQKGWQWEFDETQNYFAGCTVKDTADGKTYVCIADVNASTTHPSSDTTHWKLSDLATKEDLGNYLPLSGGALTGDRVTRNIDDDILVLFGGKGEGETGYGADIQLCGPNHATRAGEFIIWAEKLGQDTKLRGTPAGALTWGSNDLGASATVAKSIGTTGYYKRADGLIEQWGQTTAPATVSDNVPVTFPITFPNAVSSVVITSEGNLTDGNSPMSYTQVIDVTNSGFKYRSFYNSPGEIKKYWRAIGY